MTVDSNIHVSFPRKEILKWSHHSELTITDINFVMYSEALYRHMQMKLGGICHMSAKNSELTEIYLRYFKTQDSQTLL